MIERKVYISADEPNTTQWVAGVGYLDAELTREEIHKTSQASDDYRNWMRRTSPDNGRTWSELSPMTGVNVQLPGGGIATFPGNPYVHPGSGRVYRPIMKRLWPGKELYTFSWRTGEHPFNDHTFVEIDDGPAQLLRYEEGPDFDPDDPFASEFSRTNRAYRGQRIFFGADGAAYHPMVCRGSEGNHTQKSGGVVLMRREAKDETWTASDCRYVAPEISSRGMLEPDGAVLRDGRILIVCRGSDTPTTPGRKWMTWSEDGGATLHPIEELRYSDGERFYSPSSIHRFIRSTRTGTLYWLANITAEPPSGNRPRYPLVISVINEDTMSVERDSIEIVDDRGDGEPELIQFSNFHVLEDRKTLDFEIYMTRLGENGEDPRRAAAYRYVYSPQ